MGRSPAFPLIVLLALGQLPGCANTPPSAGDDDSAAANDDDNNDTSDDDDDDDLGDDDDDAANDDDLGDDDDDVGDDDDDAADDDDDDDIDVDCTAIEAASSDWELCGSWPDRCEAVFDDGAGCHAVCAAAGLPCTGAFEDVDDVCAPDLDRDPVSCFSGHTSDFCVCGGDGVPLTEDPGLGEPDGYAQLLAEREGYGASAAGGDPSTLYVVTTLDDTGPGSLRAALESPDPYWIEFDVDGTITWEDDCELQSNKTVDGRGRSVVVDGTWRLDDVHDVIISDLELTRSVRSGEDTCGQDGDVVLIRGDGGPLPADFDSHDIWLHHLWLHDGGDGLLDIRGGTNITISWSLFSSHKKVTLAWNDASGDPAEGMWVTWHHNHFDQTTVRNPRFNYGRGHLYNNVWTMWWQYAVASYNGGEIVSEGNVFDAAPDCVGVPEVLPCDDINPCGDDQDWFVDRSVAITLEGEDQSAGFASSSGDLLMGEAVVETNSPSGGIFTPPYTYSLDVADTTLQGIVVSGVGPRTTWTP